MECNHCSRGESHGEKTCVNRVPIFNGLTFEEKMEVAKIALSKDYKKGESIYMAGDKGDRLYVIHRGKVKISKISESGKEQIIRILGDGDFMGELSLFTQTPLDSNAEALEPTSVCFIEGSRLKHIMGRNPEISVKIIEELSKRLQNAENLIESLGLHDVDQRVAATLLRMADQGGEINLTITKKDLAAHIGISQETLSRKLSLFQNEGWIKQVGYRKINILHKEHLSGVADGSIKI